MACNPGAAFFLALVMAFAVTAFAGCTTEQERWPPLGASAADSAPGADAEASDADGVLPDGLPLDSSVGDDADSGAPDGAVDAGPPGLPALAIPEGCNPIAYEADCLLPYPSDFFLQPDGALPSGARVVLPAAARMRTAAGDEVDLFKYTVSDGFSHHMPILAVFPQGVSKQGLVFHLDDPARSLDASNTTLLVDAETGQLVAHWAEVDPSALSPASRALILRAYHRLENGHRYVVALQGLVDDAGTPIPPPLGFAHMLAGEASSDPVLGPLASRYETDVFPLLERLGVPRDHLQLVWDFTVGTQENATRDLVRMRDLALADLTSTPPEVVLTAVTPAPSEFIAKRIEGTIRVPFYMTSSGEDSRLNRDASGEIVQNGYVDVPFLLQIPQSVASNKEEPWKPAKLIQYGHGFFGSREEINYGFMRSYTDERRYVAAAVDWWGMSENDVLSIVSHLGTDPSGVMLFTERLHQGLVNQLALTVALQTTIPLLVDAMVEGTPAYDPQRVYWYGISQGAIMGGTLAALSPTLERIVLGVGGAPYSLMMSRSGSFAELFFLLSSILDNSLTVQKFLAISQHAWDSVDPMTYAPMVLAQPLPNSPERHLLLHMGVGDHSVPNLASHLWARSLGVPHLQPSPVVVYGLAPADAPIANGSAFVAIDYNLEVLPGVEAKIPSEQEKNDVHEDVRRNAKVQAQIDAFFSPDGPIESYCDGACDPE